MEEVFREFQRINATTWLYLSFLLIVSIYFQFNRVFSLRNLDLITLILLVPGLLATAKVERQLLAQPGSSPAEALAASPQSLIDLSRVGYIWLFIATGYFLLRSLLDLVLVRRPRPEPNLNIAGMAFLAVALLGFLMVEVMTKESDPAGRTSARIANKLVGGGAKDAHVDRPADPASVLLMSQIAAVQKQVVEGDRLDPGRESEIERGVAQSAAILCHLLIVFGLVLIGWQHFDSPSTGVGMGALYLLLPVTAINVEKVDHLLPAAFLVWAVYAYRRPWLAGILFGFAGVFVFPLFLLPLWTGFYWRRGAAWFLLAFAAVTAGLGATVYYLDPIRGFLELWNSAWAWKAWDFSQAPEPLGFWTESTRFYRLPIFIAYSALALAAAFWPKDKNLGDLIGLSVALILGVQFWYFQRGGTYIHWYLPLLLLMLLRPNLSEARPAPRTVRTA